MEKNSSRQPLTQWITVEWAIGLLEDWYIVSLGMPSGGLPHIYSKWLKSKNLQVNHSKQSMELPRALSLGLSFSRSIQPLAVK